MRYLVFNSKYKKILFSICLTILGSSASQAAASNDCDVAMHNHTQKLGMPMSLTKALASNLTTGPNGKMYPYSVTYKGKTYIQQSPEEALNLIRKFKSEGADEIRVGCLGITLNGGSDDQFAWNALNPNWNISHSLNGINKSIKSDISGPLKALMNDEPAPKTSYNPEFSTPNHNIKSMPEEIVWDKNLGSERKEKAAGAINSTWGILNNKKPLPLSGTNP